MSRKKKGPQKHIDSKRGRKPIETPESCERESLEIVDEDCNPIGILPRKEVHEKRFCHKLAHVFIFNKKGEIYLQKKSKNMDENPGLWSSSASGHVRVGESFLLTAQREPKEELSLKVRLEEVLRLKPSEEPGMRCIVLFKGKTSKTPVPNPVEIEEGRFFSPEEVDRLLKENPEQFTPAFRVLWRRFWELERAKKEK